MPEFLEYQIFLGGSVHTKGMFDGAFEEKGFISIVKIKQFKDRTEPFITFKQGAKPNFFPLGKRTENSKSKNRHRRV